MEELLGIIPVHGAWIPLFIFLARATDVTLGTMRLICVTRGRRREAIIFGFCESLIWVTAVAKVLANLDQWLNILAYAGGFATGNAVGMWIEQKLALGMQIVTLISRSKASDVAECLRRENFVVTTLEGSGRDGPMAMCMTIVPRRRAGRLLEIARGIDPAIHVTIEDVRHSTAAMPRRSVAPELAPPSA